jgi:hypothetical protein
MADLIVVAGLSGVEEGEDEANEVAESAIEVILNLILRSE